MGHPRFSKVEKKRVATEIVEIESRLPGASGQQVADQLNVGGFKTASGGAWTGSGVSNFKTRHMSRRRRTTAPRPVAVEALANGAGQETRSDRVDLACEVLASTTIPETLRKRIARELLSSTP